ncbi:hypothetical protein NDU88_011391 [Pleurodeles waltl]|uniref:Uncharacterized protein n=1 Tax=Pleurodeles waltl TaxID=8319 RepID=A0AAV7R1I4_PLEWA|nr:hypothetical protein NDU88_011391 [Pleurodeles waltl]
MTIGDEVGLPGSVAASPQRVVPARLVLRPTCTARRGTMATRQPPAISRTRPTLPSNCQHCRTISEAKRIPQIKTRRTQFGGRTYLATAAATFSTAPATCQESAPDAVGEPFSRTRPRLVRPSAPGEEGP